MHGSFRHYLLSTHFVPDAVRGAGDTAVNSTDRNQSATPLSRAAQEEILGFVSVSLPVSPLA